MLFSNIYPLIEKLSKKMTCESAKCYSTAIYTTIMVVLSLQLLGTIEKQVFDFLGYMWAPIIGNFFQIICTILGIFGTYQYRPKFIAVYSTWSLIWLGWNIFVICLYLEVGVLNRDREMYILSIGTKSKSWWLEHGIGCKVSNDSWVEDVSANAGRKIPPEEFVEGCILAYYYVEVIHAGVQCLLALTGFVFTLMAIYIYSEEQEPSATNANDELEFVKMHTLTRGQNDNSSTPSHNAASNPAYEADAQSTHTRTTHTEYQNDYPTLDRPPSYETSMRNTKQSNVNHYYGSDRQSVRSARSTRSARSKASIRSKRRQEERQERREDLPWVQITPSSSNHHTDSAPYRHFP
ncbi:sodium/potassium-transporting ATPase subunit beta-1-interacting protein 3-like [Mercenaria mercenaria]|uniref:sodium/potassium-transporting ATPase subunit beta-1-interacting protein 3-like n=1 Tax=Mercenaria mercenaria TaxID=6596 RepID=UPI00234F8724|nr:sodium/potassium-transporting ATPase subunit beta-1-interacting protein 3-like [Mercenaria mercenaria]